MTRLIPEAGDMADLTRQSSRYRELLDHLVGEVKLREDDADRYVVGLVDEGFDSVGLFDDMTTEELMSDFEWKRGLVDEISAELEGCTADLRPRQSC
eukprot:COSAG03_NODE_1274_length_4421_cov_194.692272_5_plen_97_part_00